MSMPMLKTVMYVLNITLSPWLIISHVICFGDRQPLMEPTPAARVSNNIRGPGIVDDEAPISPSTAPMLLLLQTKLGARIG
jgi:hypothetical protein